MPPTKGLRQLTIFTNRLQNVKIAASCFTKWCDDVHQPTYLPTCNQIDGMQGYIERNLGIDLGS